MKKTMLVLLVVALALALMAFSPALVNGGCNHPADFGVWLGCQWSYVVSAMQNALQGLHH